MRRIAPFPLALGLLAFSLGCHGGGGGGDGGAGDDFAVATADGAGNDDLAPGPCAGPGPAPDNWYTYGHDAQRTSTSNGCIHGRFKELWRFGGAVGDMAAPGFYNAVADGNAVYAHVAAGGVPSIYRLAAADGKKVWAHTGSADYDEGNWLTVALGYVMAVDDGLYLLDAADGTVKTTPGVDWWGQNTADDQRFYVVTSTHGDGPGAFVGAWDVAKGLVWKANQQGGCMPPVGDENGGLAVDSGVVYFAPRYETGNSSFGVGDGGTFAVPSGLYAFDAAGGAMKWSVGSDPFSAISVGNGHVYLIEDAVTLVARKQSDGSVAWSVPLGVPRSSVGRQSPVVVGGRVVIATVDHVLAFDAVTGAMAWSVPMMYAASPGYDGTINFVSCPSAGEPVALPVVAKLAAASASNTLVVAASDGLHTLALANGSELDVATDYKSATNPIVVGDRVYLFVSSMTGQQLIALQSQ